MQIVNGYICMNCCDVDKARLGQDPHQQTNQIQKQLKDLFDSPASAKAGPAVTFGGSLQANRDQAAPRPPPLRQGAPRRQWAGHVVPRGRAGLVIRATSTIEKPKQAAQHDADQKAGHQREIKRGAATLDQNVTGKAAKPDTTEPRPSQPGKQNNQSKSNQKALHIHRIYVREMGRQAEAIKKSSTVRRLTPAPLGRSYPLPDIRQPELRSP